MNYYEHHLADYTQATAHLSMLEDASYSRMLRWYYANEKPLPLEIKSIERLVRAQSKQEREAVKTVLEEFFVQAEDGWHQDRADNEIARFKESEPDRIAKRENEKERQRRSRERRKEIFETLREHGIVPAYDAPMSELQTMLSRVTSQPVTRDATATQAPSTTPSIKTQGAQAATTGLDPAAASPPEGVNPDPVGARALELVMLLRSRGAAIAAGNQHSREWAEAGVTDAQALAALETAEQRRADSGSVQPVNSGFLNTIIGDALNKLVAPKKPTPGQQSADAAQRWLESQEEPLEAHG